MIPKIQKVLYATDLSPNSTYALRYAINSAIKHDAEIIILHVFEQPNANSLAMLDLYLNEPQRRKIVADRSAEAQALIKKRLQTICDREFKDHPEYLDKVKSIEVSVGFPAEEILIKADEFNCDAIIMGTHGKGILANTFLGSTSKRVLRRSRKPIFIIPLPKGDPELTDYDV